MFATEREAQREIVENRMVRLQEFLDGERDVEDAVTIEEYALAAISLPPQVFERMPSVLA